MTILTALWRSPHDILVNKRILICSDNTSAVVYITKPRDIKSMGLHKIAHQIWSLVWSLRIRSHSRAYFRKEQHVIRYPQQESKAILLSRLETTILCLELTHFFKRPLSIDLLARSVNKPFKKYIGRKEAALRGKPNVLVQTWPTKVCIVVPSGY